jgi:hypothetical protein
MSGGAFRLQHPLELRQVHFEMSDQDGAENVVGGCRT